jgi:hypothetical protein
MTMSIVHRATGIALYAGTLLLVLWLLAAAIGGGFFRRRQLAVRQLARADRPVRLHLGAVPPHARRHPPFHLGFDPGMMDPVGRESCMVRRIQGASIVPDPAGLGIFVWFK